MESTTTHRYCQDCDGADPTAMSGLDCDTCGGSGWIKRDTPMPDAHSRVIERYNAICKAHGIKGDPMTVGILLLYVQRFATLDLRALADRFTEVDFAHDIGGILNNTDIDGRLMNGFTPRCTVTRKGNSMTSYRGAS